MLSGMRISTCTSPSNNLSLGSHLTTRHRDGTRSRMRGLLGGGGISTSISARCATRS